jgi:argininosuccinate lyase
VPRLWDKGAPLDARVLAYTAGEDHALDERLVAYDVAGSIAHAETLAAAGLLSRPELERLTAALSEIGAAHARGEWRIPLELEDGQTALETKLVERVGALGGKIHAGRSRNDQVLAALRLYLKDAIASLNQAALALAAALDSLAQSHGSIALPGYTHMQQAMPSSVALWAGGYAAELREDAAGLLGAGRRLNLSPLGSAAGYGTPGLDLDREYTARRLGFSAAQVPVTAVQLSRGKAEAGVVFEIALLMTGLGRLATDLLLFASQEFGFVVLPDAFTTGSSIMPHKRNPDLLELVRGRSVTAQACLSEILALTAKLPSGYQRDLQLIKAPLFRAIDLCAQTLGLLPAAIAGLSFQPENIRLHPAIHSAEEANLLVVKEGIPFREAYARVAERLARGEPKPR